MSNNFAVIGAGGYIAPRHLRAIRDTGNRLLAAVDPKDSVGVLDQYSYDVRFFTEIERFDRHLEKLRRGPEEGRVHFVTVCSPNYLHDAHCRLAMRVGADVICEKPLAINPWNLDALEEIESETGRRVNTILQLRVHPSLIQLRESLQSSNEVHDVELTYITSRGPWYQVSWKGDHEKSGGVATNIGVHFFDMLMWLFGSVNGIKVYHSDKERMSGFIELERARVRWFLSVNRNDLPEQAKANNKTTYRSITVDGKEIEFSEGFTDLHTKVYEETLAGRGFGIKVARPSVQLTHDIRESSISPMDALAHPFLKKIDMTDYFVHESSYVDEGAEIGAGTKIWHFCHVMPRAKIGERCNIGQNVLVSSDVTIGTNVKIQNNVSLYTGVIVEDDVFLGPSMVFTNVINPRSHVSRKDEYKTTLVRKGASIGANATIVCGTTLGRYCFVGAGAVVTKDVPDYALVYGTPARVRGWVCQCGEQLNFEGERAVCSGCGNAYRKQDSVVSPERGEA